MKNKVNSIDDAVKRLNDLLEGGEACNADFKELMDHLPAILVTAIENGDIDTCDISNLKQAMRLCRLVQEESVWADKEHLAECIVEDIKNRRRIERWIRGLSSVHTPEKFKRELLSQAMLSVVNTKVLSALEQEMDASPHQELAEWYVALLERGINGRPEEQAYRRLAYYYLNLKNMGMPGSEEKAAAYLKSMERRGLLFCNPYSGEFGEKTFKDEIERLLR